MYIEGSAYPQTLITGTTFVLNSMRIPSQKVGSTILRKKINTGMQLPLTEYQILLALYSIYC